MTTAAFDARPVNLHRRARAANARLRWLLLTMMLLNVLVWGGMIAALRGVVDVHGTVDQAWALGSTWLAALPHLSVTVTR
ncbi:hypothetical protein [Caulobacter sp. DWP3-1-3b2]|uniref:hypothetical protein n=1 Tax=Caulobacter sp. DWP3-1-3b2 TaxID=2804643 RepID=UPI003CEFB3AF